jgi:hypothetical protein
MNIIETIKQARELVNEMPEVKMYIGPCEKCGKPDSPWSLSRKDYICDKCLKKEFNHA